MADRIVMLAFDAENKQIIGQITDTSGGVISAWGTIKLTLGKDPGSVPSDPGHTMGKEIKFRETVGCDPESGEPRYCIMLRSEWYETALTADPET